MSSKITPPTVSAGPPGFDDNGRRVIKDVGEFRLVEWFPGGPIIVEYSKEIRAALTKARFRISEARDKITTPDERAMLAGALFSLYIDAREGLDNPRLASRLRDTLGVAILEAMQAQDVECAIEGCGAKFRAALRSIAVASGALRDKHSQRKRKPKPEVVAIQEGGRIFRETQERPTKTAIRAAMEAQGIVFDKRHARARWSDIFILARLHNLAD
jgi:hypothetical protein